MCLTCLKVKSVLFLTVRIKINIRPVCAWARRLACRLRACVRIPECVCVCVCVDCGGYGSLLIQLFSRACSPRYVCVRACVRACVCVHHVDVMSMGRWVGKLSIGSWCSESFPFTNNLGSPNYVQLKINVHVCVCVCMAWVILHLILETRKMQKHCKIHLEACVPGERSAPVPSGTHSLCIHSSLKFNS